MFFKLIMDSGAMGIAVVVIVITGLGLFLWRTGNSSLDMIPTVGSGYGWLGSWLDGFKSLTNAVDIIQQGYEKHKSAPFKIANRFYWMIIFSNRKHIEEVVRAPEEELSFVEGTNDQLNIRYTLGDEVHNKHFHVAAVLSHLTRNIGTLYPRVKDEIVTAFDEVLDLRGNEWKTVAALGVAQKVVCRTSNRLFVGLPLCRDPDWIDLNIQYAIDITITGVLLGLFPKFMRPLAVRFFTGITKGAKRGSRHLGPIIKERLEHGDRMTEKPNDLISWLMEEAGGYQLTPEALTSQVLAVNFTAIHTTSYSFAHALLYLAANPQYIQPLRDEVEVVVKAEGWSKTSVSKMHKVDSFLTECQRLEGINVLPIIRKCMKDFTFSDGTFMPKGTLIGVTTRPIHHDENAYEDPKVFKPFRFVDADGGDEEGAKHQYIKTSLDYLAFGHGRHKCPGRFFAASELKSMLAHIVVAYDIKLEDNTTHPPSLCVGTWIAVDPRAKVQFRKRIK